MMAVDARMIDTKFFDERFKARLLRALPDLDKQCDGVLVHSENFQALRMLEPTYHGKAKGIYIDPPYNTGGDGFLYRDAYKDSSWMSMILDRLSLGRLFCTKDGAVVASIDETEQTNFRKVFDLTWGQQNYIADFVWAAGRKNDSRYVSISHEYMLCFARDKESLDASKIEWRQKKKGLEDIYAEYEKLKKKYKTDYVTMTKELKAWFKSLPDSHPAKAHKHYSVVDERGIYFPDNISWPGGGGPRYEVPHPVTHKPVTVPSRGWIFSTPERMAEIIAEGRVQFGEDENAVPCLKSYLKEREYAAPYSVFYQDGRAATKRLRQIMGNDDFGFPKDETVIADTISCWTGNTDLFLDYFAGSGTTAHAVISLNREDKEQGHRKYILVEMGDHFDTVLKPRIEKVVYSPEWKDGKPVSSTRGISHCFKYLTLESYEDTLNNLKLETPKGAELGIGKNEYMMNYMLDIESRASLLSVDKLRHPFDYTLDIAIDSSGATAPRKVDLVETFNYLVGLTVETEDRHIDKGYVLVTGTLPSGEDAIILWRDCDKVDNAKLREILKKQAINPRAQGFVLYVNGDHDLHNSVKGDDGAEKTIKVASIDATFLEKMFAED